MKWLFRKSKSTSKPPALQERLAERLVGSVLRGQRTIADKLNGATAGWSGLKKRFALYLFCLLFGGGSTIVMVNAINAPAQKSPAVITEPAIKLPVRPQTRDMDIIRQSQVKELEAIQHRLDSLPADSISYKARAQFEELKKQILNP